MGLLVDLTEVSTCSMQSLNCVQCVLSVQVVAETNELFCCKRERTHFLQKVVHCSTDIAG